MWVQEPASSGPWSGSAYWTQTSESVFFPATLDRPCIPVPTKRSLDLRELGYNGVQSFFGRWGIERYTLILKRVNTGRGGKERGSFLWKGKAPSEIQDDSAKTIRGIPGDASEAEDGPSQDGKQISGYRARWSRLLPCLSVFRSWLLWCVLEPQSCRYCDYPVDNVENTLFVCVRWGVAREAVSRAVSDELTPDTMVPLMLQSQGFWKHIELFITLAVRTKDLDRRMESSNGEGQ